MLNGDTLPLFLRKDVILWGLVCASVQGCDSRGFRLTGGGTRAA
jgi:hypothetical protein